MNYKLRIKHPSGAEFEAEGPVEFIRNEKEGFLRALPGAAAGEPQKYHAEPAAEPAWSALAETRNGLLILKNKHHGLKAGEAALLLLACERQVNKTLSLGAITLSKAIKASGYAPERVDRMLAKATREGLVKASGTKRNRAYQITDKGLERAWLEARKLE
ncbi:MAG: hypothetical protein NDI60_07965 [Elusimicrobiales bacterium]|nr:hypothetical protein [Elusimicrobiales bacterium]